MTKYKGKHCNCIASFSFFVMITVTMLTNTALSDGGEHLFVAGTAVNLREGPFQKSPTTLQLPYGTVGRVEGRVDCWIKVTLRDSPDIAGFLHKSVTRELGSEIPDRDRKRVRHFKEKLVAPSSLVDFEKHADDLLPDIPSFELLPQIFKARHESLERWIYREGDAVGIKYRIWLLRVLGIRHSRFGNVYRKTPVALLNNSPIYQLPASVYMRAVDAPTWEHHLDLPLAKSSFFLELPRHLLVTHARMTPYGAVVCDNQPNMNADLAGGEFLHSDILFVYLLQTYFANGHSFRIDRRDECLFLESADEVAVAVSDTRGEQVHGALTRIEFDIGRGEIRLPGIQSQTELMLVYLGQPSVINKITIQRNFFVTTITTKKPRCTRMEVDFDRDKVVDLVRTVVLTSDHRDLMGTFDLVFAYNVAGRWQKILKQRVQIVP